MRRLLIQIAVISIITIAGLILWRNRQVFGPRPNDGRRTAPAETTVVAADAALTQYAGSESCKNCHRSEYDRWAGSHHALAERLISAAEDKIAFDPPRTISHGTQSSTVRIENGQFQVVAAGLLGKSEPHSAIRVIGVDPLRQFLVDGPRGQVQATELAYDPRRNEWFDVYGAENRQPGEWGHWTGRGMTWNAMCAACHNTRLRKNYDENSDSYQTRMAEMSVGCEACHGPMKAHAQWREDQKNTGKQDQSLAHPSRDQNTDTCASCHSRRADLTGDFVPGQKFFDHYALSGVDDSDLFYPDGQIHEEDYEYSAFLGSKMHAAGVRCMDCHDVHSGKTLFDGDALCMRCHVGAYPKAPIINPAVHTFHTPQSAGSRCVNCHMPQTPYMQRHNRHDHGFTTPDPLLTKQIGVPNACNRCHVDKNADWSLAAVEKWYGPKLDRPSRKRALIVAAARRHEAWSKPPLLALLADPAATGYWKSGFVRLLAQWADDAGVRDAVNGQLRDGDPMTRESAVAALAPLVQNKDVAQSISGLLDDPSRNVRIAAAHALEFTVTDGVAARDFLNCLIQQADEPIGRLALARFCVTRHDTAGAEVHLQKAVEFDPRSADLRHDVAVLFGRIRKPLDALAQINEACRLEPGNSELWFLAGLAASEAGQPEQATAAFERAVSVDPKNARAWYNLAISREKAEKYEAALAAYASAETADPLDADVPYARATLLVRLNRKAEARQALARALKINPNSPQAAPLIQRLQETP